MFLLRRLVKSEGEEGVEGGPAGESGREVAADPAELKRQLQEMEKELERLRKEKGDIASRLDVRTLEIATDKVELVYYDPQPVRLATKEQALQLIGRHRAEAQKNRREMYYFFFWLRQTQA